jgi:formate C-acetyltransferase
VSLARFGDGSEESSRFAARFYDDLCALGDGYYTAYGGKCRIGFNLYTEIVLVGERTGALPNGRKSGDYLSQGITPSRLGKERSFYDFLDSYRYIDFEKTAGNASLTLTLPLGKANEEQMVSLFRVLAHNGLQAIQPNCVDKDLLLAAQKDPENYKDIIVSVCGFSAPFVCLSEKYQDEVISRSVSSL